MVFYQNHQRAYYESEPEKLLVNAFFNGQFNYCPVVCMPHSHKLNNNINRLQTRFAYDI